ncbi:ABC transporter ATP-binding protein [Breznakia sp. OttesenSCG-928-G09]|nr:ABC transporter ATP-binding protein [Breznakia sp. OttesenSCG-928-G09]
MKTINVENLSKAYDQKEVLKGISFSVDKGEVFGLLGANGAGKTTTIECVLGTRVADQGKISVLGKNPRKERKSLFKHVGVQFQEGSYQDKIKVNELCEETSSFYTNPQDYKVLLKQFGLEEKISSMVKELSGGQRQRLFIVLALLPNPEVLFLDELTTGLDTQARRFVWESIKKLKEAGMSIFLTSHFMDEVEILCDQIGILKEGRFIYYGSVKDAIKESPYETLEDAYLWYINKEDNDIENF